MSLSLPLLCSGDTSHDGSMEHNKPKCFFLFHISHFFLQTTDFIDQQADVGQETKKRVWLGEDILKVFFFFSFFSHSCYSFDIIILVIIS